MRALVVTEHGSNPRFQEIIRPKPLDDEIAVEIHACGLNFADLLMVKGTYQDTPPLPFTPGLEVAGRVCAIGASVQNFKSGDRVAVFGGQGGLAEVGCFPANRAVLLPEGMPFAQAAGFQVAYGTSHLALDHRAHLQPGETLLVLGAAGGVGLTAVEIGKRMGATVIACARGADKLQAATNAGADHVIDATTQDIREATLALGGADVVYDPVGGDQFTGAFRACNPEARLLTIGFASGDVPQIKANHLLVKNISVIGLYWGGYLTFKPKVLTESLGTLLDWYSEGTLTPHVSHVLPFDQAQAGLDLLRDRKSTGKVVIQIRD